MASFLFSREEISQLKIEPPTSSLRCNNTYQTCQMSSFKLVVHIFGPGAGHPQLLDTNGLQILCINTSA
jgi:hypothetical protein